MFSRLFRQVVDMSPKPKVTGSTPVGDNDTIRDAGCVATIVHEMDQQWQDYVSSTDPRCNGDGFVEIGVHRSGISRRAAR